MLKIISIVGARPNFIKIAPFIRAIEVHNECSSKKVEFVHILVHTGQHYDHNMSDLFFEDLNIPDPDFYLGVGSGSPAYQIGQTMIEFEKVLLKEKPDWVVVVGDVNATLACSVIAKQCNVKVAHIEAGLRSNDWTMPEEINRIITDRLSDLLFTPCHFADANLKAEGVANIRIVRVGNIMIDTLEEHRAEATRRDINEVLSHNHPEYSGYKSKNHTGYEPLQEGEFGVLTLHRPSNVDDPDVLGKLMDVLVEISEQIPIIFPIHPRTHKRLVEFDLYDVILENDGIYLTQPLSYIDMMSLNLRAKILLTDSGGLQEEAAVFGTPCLTLRSNTERPVTLVENGGTNYIVGNDPDKIRAAFFRVIAHPPEGHRPELWDGNTAERIVKTLIERS